jgi:hypothetical protein
MGYKLRIPYFMVDIGGDLYKNKENIMLILIILLIIYLFLYKKIETKKEPFNSTEREMYVPNCNFLTDTNICSISGNILKTVKSGFCNIKAIIPEQQNYYSLINSSIFDTIE